MCEYDVSKINGNRTCMTMGSNAPSYKHSQLRPGCGRIRWGASRVPLVVVRFSAVVHERRPLSRRQKSETRLLMDQLHACACLSVSHAGEYWTSADEEVISEAREA